MKIFWSELAESDFEQNLIYIYERWNESVVQDFTIKTERILKIITETPKAFQKYKKNIHFVPITKHITLFYNIKRNEIELVRFWNNFQEPDSHNIG